MIIGCGLNYRLLKYIFCGYQDVFKWLYQNYSCGGNGRERLDQSSSSPFFTHQYHLNSPSWVKDSSRARREARTKRSYTRFSTPGHPLPLARFRRLLNSPLGGNASFSHPPRHGFLTPRGTPSSSAPRLNAMPGDGLHSYSFSPGACRGSFGGGGRGKSQEGHWLFRSYVSDWPIPGAEEGRFVSVANPNQAVFTIDDQARILTANDVCSALLGRPEEELCGGQTKLKDFLSLHSLDLLHQSSPIISASDFSQHPLPLTAQSNVLKSSSVQFEDTGDCYSITDDHDAQITNIVEPLVSLSVPGEIPELKASTDSIAASINTNNGCENCEDPVDHSSDFQCYKKPFEQQQAVSGSEGKCVSASLIASTPSVLNDFPATPTHTSPESRDPSYITAQSSNNPKVPVFSDSDFTPMALPERWIQSDVLQEAEILKKEGQVLYSGKVVSLVSAEGKQQFCSLWLKALPKEEEKEGETRQEREARWVAVLEPVELLTSKAVLNPDGVIQSHEPSFPTLFGHPRETKLEGARVVDFIPSLKLPQDNHQIIEEEFAWQHCTGFTPDLSTFPLEATLSSTHAGAEACITLELWVLSHMSGLVVVDTEGRVVDYNRSFTRLMFGYTDDQLIGKCVTQLIPGLYEEVWVQGDRDYGRDGPSFTLDCDAVLSDVDDTHKENTEDNGRSCEVTQEPVTSLSDLPSSINTPNTAFVATESKLHGSLFVSSMSSGGNGTNSEGTQAMRDITNSLNIVNLSEQMTGSPSTTGSPRKCQSSNTFTKVSMYSNLTPGIMMRGDDSEQDLVTSTPAPERSEETRNQLEEGVYFGYGRHKDGSDLAILYHIRQMEMSGAPHYCLWITRHSTRPLDGAVEKMEEMSEIPPRRPDCLTTLPPPPSLTTTNPSPLTESTDVSLGHVIKAQAQQAKRTDKYEEVLDEDTDNDVMENKPQKEGPQNKRADGKEVDDEDTDDDSRHTSTNGSSGAEYSLIHSRRGNMDATSSSCVDEELERQTAGEFSHHYTVLRQIGKGAFGCVRMSVRNSDGLLVVTKFIKKSKVYKDSWVDDLLLRRRVPLEVSLLMTLDHPNIVSVHEMFESDDYFQLVMEKWGAGMDLFEFIDRNPALDEPLAAHIFRQIVSALRYLHSLSIVHRDVKDENVILDANFHVKLIDFGSAAFTRPGRTFAQFAGTVEYCSPEVLKGNRYSGYELEVWSLGVTMYTLMYGENPFYDIDQTISAPLSFPFYYSVEMTSLLRGMLEKDVSSRMTLEEVALHPWTQTPCVIEDYPFHEVVKCTYEECHPPTHASPGGPAGDTSLSTTSDSFVYEAASRQTNQARRSLSFSPCRRRSLNDNDVVRLQRSATSLSSSHLTAELEDREEEEEDGGIVLLPLSSGASRTSTAQSVSSIRSTITVDSSSFSCCSPSSHSTSSTHPDSSLPSSTHLGFVRIRAGVAEPSVAHRREPLWFGAMMNSGADEAKSTGTNPSTKETMSSSVYDTNSVEDFIGLENAAETEGQRPDRPSSSEKNMSNSASSLEDTLSCPSLLDNKHSSGTQARYHHLDTWASSFEADQEIVDYVVTVSKSSHRSPKFENKVRKVNSNSTENRNRYSKSIPSLKSGQNSKSSHKKSKPHYLSSNSEATDPLSDWDSDWDSESDWEAPGVEPEESVSLKNLTEVSSLTGTDYSWLESGQNEIIQERMVSLTLKNHQTDENVACLSHEEEMLNTNEHNNREHCCMKGNHEVTEAAACSTRDELNADRMYYVEEESREKDMICYIDKHKIEEVTLTEVCESSAVLITRNENKPVEYINKIHENSRGNSMAEGCGSDELHCQERLSDKCNKTYDNYKHSQSSEFVDTSLYGALSCLSSNTDLSSSFEYLILNDSHCNSEQDHSVNSELSGFELPIDSRYSCNDNCSDFEDPFEADDPLPTTEEFQASGFKNLASSKDSASRKVKMVDANGKVEENLGDKVEENASREVEDVSEEMMAIGSSETLYLGSFTQSVVRHEEITQQNTLKKSQCIQPLQHTPCQQTQSHCTHLLHHSSLTKSNDVEYLEELGSYKKSQNAEFIKRRPLERL
ncbi:hypothetical protein Pmani_009237 [Petrolisthes manimaculis]|uniref:PAS domain-containing serine/threonine-protein kinase n=1 Tax=Petrolisthes manimaculis TaxID=1843537 RepID=A0AAE1UI40_9EUCA|nr:hypothetical protein Pmani_009237 [Petrolisthes manimaculis]